MAGLFANKCERKKQTETMYRLFTVIRPEMCFYRTCILILFKATTKTKTKAGFSITTKNILIIFNTLGLMFFATMSAEQFCIMNGDRNRLKYITVYLLLLHLTDILTLTVVKLTLRVVGQ